MNRCVLLVSLVALAFVSTPAGGQQGSSVGSSMTEAELEGEISRREEDLQRYGQQLERLEREISAVQSTLDRRQEELDRQEVQVRAQIVTLCRLQRGGFLHLLRGARSWSDLVRRVQYARAVADHDMTALADHQRRVDELAEQRAALAGRVESQRRLRERIVTYRRDLEAERERRQSPGDMDLDDLPLFGL